MLRCVRNGAERTNIVLKGLDVVRQYAALLERRVQTGTRARKALVVTRQANPLGRSMIEMLGVLAIIGVLSVGGIAGYSKAMEKWKVNKLIGEYTEFMFNAIEHADDIRKVPNGSGYADIMQPLNAIPTSWTYDNASNVHDRLNNRIQIWRGGSDLVFEIYLLEEYEVKDSYSLAEQRVQLCRELFLNFVQPLSEFVDYSYVWRGDAQTLNPLWYGNNYCGADKKCLKNVTLAEINAACHTCGDSNGTCSIVITY
ncbi:MAG: type II secretion system protein [Alphaproteobacteria bacterium]|nr:type II secretion system protein [Alphaproteobacteria bacterium]